MRELFHTIVTMKTTNKKFELYKIENVSAHMSTETIFSPL
jgi:hypothetical protein